MAKNAYVVAQKTPLRSYIISLYKKWDIPLPKKNGGMNLSEEVLWGHFIEELAKGGVVSTVYWGHILGDVDKQLDLKDAFDSKVDKIAGKILTTNDLTDILKQKLDGIQANAEKNVQSNWNQIDDTSAEYIRNKPNISEVGDGQLTIQLNGTLVGTFTANATSDKTINLQPTKNSVGLGNVNNTTDANKPISTLTQTALDTKLEDIIAGSSNVTIDRTEPLKPTITVSTDIAWGSITGTLSSQTDLDTALGGKVSIQQTVADEGKSLVVDSTGKLALKILDTLEFYGPYDAIADLPLTPNLNGIYLVGTASPYSMYIYTNNQWLAAGSTDIDLSSYVTKTELENVVTNLTTIVAAEETAKEDKLALDGDANTFSYMQSQNLLKITNSSTAQTPTSVAAGGIITFNCIPVGLASHMKADKAIFTTVANSGGTDYDIVVDFSLGGTVVETYKLWDSTTQTLTDFDLSSLNVYILTLDGEWDAQTDVSSFGTFQIRFPLYVNRAPILPYVGTTDSIPVAKNDGTYIWVSSGNFGKKYTQTFTLPNNYEITINHNLGTKFIINNIYELAGEEVSASVTVLNDNSIKLEFSSDTPTGSQYNIVIMG